MPSDFVRNKVKQNLSCLAFRFFKVLYAWNFIVIFHSTSKYHKQSAPSGLLLITVVLLGQIMKPETASVKLDC